MNILAHTAIVHGSRGCGKTRNATAIAQHFGCETIIDEWLPDFRPLKPGALHLTNSDNLTFRNTGPTMLRDFVVVSYAQLQKDGVVT